jgi:hypothetical protein
MDYIELHTRSAFSFLAGGSLPEDLVARAAARALQQTERDVLPDQERVEQGAALEQHAELVEQFLALAAALAPHVLAIDEDLAGIGRDHACH